jgi:hypothetical protein
VVVRLFASHLSHAKLARDSIVRHAANLKGYITDSFGRGSSRGSLFQVSNPAGKNSTGSSRGSPFESKKTPNRSSQALAGIQEGEDNGDTENEEETWRIGSIQEGEDNGDAENEEETTKWRNEMGLSIQLSGRASSSADHAVI